MKTLKTLLIGVVALLLTYTLFPSASALAGPHGRGGPHGEQGEGADEFGNAIGEEFFESHPHTHPGKPESKLHGHHEEHGRALGEEFFESHPHKHHLKLFKHDKQR